MSKKLFAWSCRKNKGVHFPELQEHELSVELACFSSVLKSANGSSTTILTLSRLRSRIAFQSDSSISSRNKICSDQMAERFCVHAYPCTGCQKDDCADQMMTCRNCFEVRFCPRCANLGLEGVRDWHYLCKWCNTKEARIGWNMVCRICKKYRNRVAQGSGICRRCLLIFRVDWRPHAPHV